MTSNKEPGAKTTITGTQETVSRTRRPLWSLEDTTKWACLSGPLVDILDLTAN